MKHKIVLYFSSFLLFGLSFATANATAQTIGYRQSNLASNLPNVAGNITPGLINPWGMAFLKDQPFFLADNNAGRATSHDASGIGVAPSAFIVPNAAGTGFDSPTGIVADENSFFGGPSLEKPFILVTDQGTVFTWGPDARGDLPSEATRVVNNSSRGAVYKGVAILDSSLTAPALAVTDFEGGFVETFLQGFSPLALPGSFTDPNLPSGYAPFGIQVIGNQVFVTYALQDAAKHDPVFGAGNGVVSVFDMDGNFVKRFATGGALNAPWGITQASANFGPFSNDILIGNIGDGNINAFDPATGQFVGELLDGEGFPIAEVGLHALAFRADRLGDPSTLYFASQLNDENDGLFGAITTGFLSVTRVSAPNTPADTSVAITASVRAGLGNTGTPTGTVTFLDGSNRLGTSPLVNGLATINAILTGAGVHALNAQYSGDAVFLSSSDRIPEEVTGIATMSMLTAPAEAAPGSPITLTATINSAGGIPTGQVVFLDGNANLGASRLNDDGVAILRINTLAAGTHTLTASYAGDEKFGGSMSPGVAINIANTDFSLGTTPSAATVVAGQSTQFMLTVTPAGGFAGSITFSCSPVTSISCTFNPGMVTPTSGTASTQLTITTSASVTHFGLLVPDLIGPSTLLVVLVCLFGLAIWPGGGIRPGRTSLLTATVAVAIIGLGLAIGGCGRNGSTMQTNRGTASILVTAQSGSIAHTTTVNVTVE